MVRERNGGTGEGTREKRGRVYWGMSAASMSLGEDKCRRDRRWWGWGASFVCVGYELERWEKLEKEKTHRRSYWGGGGGGSKGDGGGEVGKGGERGSYGRGGGHELERREQVLTKDGT